jgi:hypothetical protein
MAKRGATYEPTKEDRDFVERMAMAGSTTLKIAECLNIHDDTLRKHFRYELVTGRERLKANAIRVLMDSLTDGSLDAAKFVLVKVAGWSETQKHEISGPDGSPVQVQQTIDPSKLSSAALAEILAAKNGSNPG